MRHIPLVLASLGLFSVVVTGRAAMAGTGTSLASSSVLAVDDIPVARVLRWEGGDLRATTLSVASPTGGLPTKSAGMSAVAPLILQVNVPPPPKVAELINELSSGASTRHTLRVTDYNSSGGAASALELTGAMLTEVTFPAFDATSTPVGPMTLTFAAEASSVVAPTGRASEAPPATSAVSSFQLTIAGVDGRGVMLVEPLTLRRVMSADVVGAGRVAEVKPASVEVGNLRVKINAARSTAWTAWWNDFVVQGHSADANEKAGSLQLIDASGKPMSVALNFEHLGIIRVSRSSTTAGATQTVEAELYLERLSLSTPVVPPPVDPPDPPPPSDPPADSAAKPSDPAAPTDSPTAATPTPVMRAGEVPTVSPTPARALPAAIEPNPADVGARDPAQFPRVSGLTRTYYSGTFQPNYTSENA